MTRSYKYAIAQLHANPIRGERLNLAVVVFNEDSLTVYPARNLEKVWAISAALKIEVVQESLNDLPALDKFALDQFPSSIDDRIASISSLSPVQFSACSEFYADDSHAYQSNVQRLLSNLVEPEPALQRPIKRKATRLLTSVKSAFRAEKILARKGEGIDSHRVISNHEIAEGLNADLLLKNGAMHVVQTVDASHTERSRYAIQEIGMSVLVFEQARMHFGNDQTNSQLVYSANTQLERSIRPSLDAAEHQGAELVNWESRDDRTKFIVDLSHFAEPLEDNRRAIGSVNASTQHRFKLN